MMLRGGQSGILFVVSAPSGAGKTSLCRGVQETVPCLRHSVSYTTRKPRPAEIDGVHYHFVEASTFEKCIEENEFLEWAKVHGHLYGTPRVWIREMTRQGIDVILDVNTQGAETLRKQAVEGVWIYILPPSFEVLRQRLQDRKSDAEAEIERRLETAKEEIQYYRQHDYVVVNNNYKEALRDLSAIIRAERIKTRRVNLSWIEETFV